MGRKRKSPTRMVRVRLVDLNKLKELARASKLSLPDYISKLTKRRYKWKL